jgi:hypothetical protein
MLGLMGREVMSRSAPLVSTLREWPKRYGFAFVLFSLGVTVCVVGAVLGIHFARDPSTPFGLDLARDTVTLGTGLILGGALKALLDRYQQAQKEQVETHELRERLLADIRDVYDQTERARLMVRARGSAEAYGDQMQILIGCQAKLLRLKRSLELRWSVLNHVDPEGRCLRQMIGYLRALQDEYAENYQRVLDCEHYDEEIMRRRLSELAAAGSPPCGSNADVITHHTRALLDDKHEFPVLYDLIKCGLQYNDNFAQPLHMLAAELLMTTDTCRELDTQFDDHVDDAARSILQALDPAATTELEQR